MRSRHIRMDIDLIDEIDDLVKLLGAPSRSALLRLLLRRIAKLTRNRRRRLQVGGRDHDWTSCIPEADGV